MPRAAVYGGQIPRFCKSVDDKANMAVHVTKGQCPGEQSEAAHGEVGGNCGSAWQCVWRLQEVGL